MNGPAADRPSRTRRRGGILRAHPGITRSVVLGAAAALLAACGSTSSPGTGNVKGTSAAANTPAGASTPATASQPAVVAVAMVSVKGTSEQVLTASSGDTLYYRTSDTATNVTCTGACAGVWPPLLLASGQPSASTSLPDALTVVSGGNGRQVEYDGHPLYTYSGDSGPDQSNGEGVGGVWFVVTPTLGGGAGSATPAASVSAPGGY